jgi:hypothetical protein
MILFTIVMAAVVFLLRFSFFAVPHDWTMPKLVEHALPYVDHRFTIALLGSEGRITAAVGVGGARVANRLRALIARCADIGSDPGWGNDNGVTEDGHRSVVSSCPPRTSPIRNWRQPRPGRSST